MIDIEILIELGLLQLFATEILLLLLVLFMVFVRRKFKILIKLSVRRLQNLLVKHHLFCKMVNQRPLIHQEY
jgi:hypothetical protein